MIRQINILQKCCLKLLKIKKRKNISKKQKYKKKLWKQKEITMVFRFLKKKFKRINFLCKSFNETISWCVVIYFHKTT